jgi:hypothetical protein
MHTFHDRVLSSTSTGRAPRAAGFVAAVLASAATSVAQVPPVFLCGQATEAGTASNVVLGACSFPVTLCATGITAPLGFEGGSAFDPVNQLHWNSNGSRLQASLSTSGFECDMSCDAPSPVPNVTGLAFDARTVRLWILAAAPEIVRTSVDGVDCPRIESRCSLAGVIPPGMVAAGLALSEKRGLLFYAVSRVGSSPDNAILVATTADPCRVVCRVELGAAFGASQTDPITGLGYDDCDDELFAVAGSAGILRVRLGFPGCAVTSRSLCVPSGNHRFHGLCLQSPPAAVVGHACLEAPCARCTTRLRANDPSLGNTRFWLSFAYAPNGGVVVPVLSAGACGSGVPALCGRFYPSLAAPIVLPAMALSGPSSCTGAALLFLPIAPDPALCGLSLCVQGIVGCAAGGVGLSNALSIRVVGA